LKYDMRHRITLQNRTSVQDPVGNRDESYAFVATFLAAYVPNTGRMYGGGGEIHSETDCRVSD